MSLVCVWGGGCVRTVVFLCQAVVCLRQLPQLCNPDGGSAAARDGTDAVCARAPGGRKASWLTERPVEWWTDGLTDSVSVQLVCCCFVCYGTTRTLLTFAHTVILD